MPAGNLASGPSVQAQLAAPSIPNATIAVVDQVTQSSTIDDIPPHPSLTVDVTITNSSEIWISGFAIELAYDSDVFTATSLTYANSILSGTGATLFISRYCLDGLYGPGQTSQQCGADDGHGITSLALTSLGCTYCTQPLGISSGLLFSETFGVTLTPSSGQIQIKLVQLSNGTPQIIPDNTIDAFYTSKSCGGVPCRPPKADFTWTPIPAQQQDSTAFNASGSVPGPNGVITEYVWNWGDHNQFAQPTSDVCAYPYQDPHAAGPKDCYSNPHLGCALNQPNGTLTITDKTSCYNIESPFTPLNNTSTHVFATASTYSVTLTVRDSWNTTSSKTQDVKVINSKVDLGVESFGVSPLFGTPSTAFTFNAVIKNFGGVTVNDTSLTLTVALLQPILLKTISITSIAPSTSQNITATWDTSKNNPATGKPFVPNVYRIDATIPFVVNATSGKILEKNLLNNVKSTWVELQYPSPLGLGLLPTVGVGVIIVGVVGYGVSWIRKRSRPIEL